PGTLEPSGLGTVASILYVPSPHEPDVVGARLGEMGLTVTQASDPAEAMRLLKARAYTAALVHLTDDRGAISVIRALRAQAPQMTIGGLMDPARPLAAAEAIRAGVVE